MTYTVTWSARALARLADVWLHASNRNAVTAASYAIDNILRDDPDLVGAHRFDTVREFHYPPLGIDFEVIEANRLLIVHKFWPTPSRAVENSRNLQSQYFRY